MYTVDELMKLMDDSGKTSADLAKEFTDALNKATQKKKERDAAEAKNRKALQIEDTVDLIDNFLDYIATYYPKLKIELFDGDVEMLAKALVEGFDRGYDDAVKDFAFIDRMAKLARDPITVKPSEDVLSKFLRENGL